LGKKGLGSRGADIARATPADSGSAAPSFYFLNQRETPLPVSRERAPASPPTGFNVEQIRKDFPALHQEVNGKPLVWLDNAATTHKPQSVIDAISRFYENDNSNIHRGAHTLAARATDAFEQARQKVQTFLGAPSAKDIVFVRGTTEGINLVAQTYGRKFLQPGDEIILSQLEHHANIVPWQLIAQEKGAVIRVIPVNDRGELILEAYERLLGPRTKLVALTHASNSIGTVLPVAELTRSAKRYNARVLIDGAQSVSHMPVNVQDIGADFFVFSGHKLFGPTGIGAVYIREELHDILPPWQGGGNMIKNVTFEETTYNGAPAKFEAGTPNIADAVGLGAAIDYVNRLGLANTGKYEHELLLYATEQLKRINGVRILGDPAHKVSVISFVVRDRKTEEVGRLLDQEGIAVRAGHHCAQPSLRRFGVEASVRPSLAFYNTYEEIDRLAAAVKRIANNS
jgi:cysteine desulfurase/selenocysteine lyase